MDQRRAHYRVAVDPTTDLRATIRLPAGDLDGQLMDVSAAGAGMRFKGDDAPNLAVGDEVELVFRSKKLTLAVPARVQHRTEDDDGRRYGFRFLQPQKLAASIPPGARELFNRRRVNRITPDPMCPVPVMLSPYPEGPPVEARLQDISELGAGVSVEGSREEVLRDTLGVRVTIELPAAPVQMVGLIRYRRLGGHAIFYGIEFDDELTDEWGRQVEAIERYIIMRQREMLRDAG
jgi:c-di-GMP-binding flagellar brake protein YcgR